MFQKIKELMQVKKNIDELSKKIEEHKATIASFRESINALKNEMRDIKEGHKELLTNLKDSMGSIDDVKEEFKKELYEFNLLKGHLQSKIIEKFENELQKELNINLEKFKRDAENYLKLKNDISLISENTKNLSGELNKFVEIGRNIKKEDFLLTKYCNKIWEMDKEKLELMKRIDTLERLIAKMRRGEQVRR